MDCVFYYSLFEPKYFIYFINTISVAVARIPSVCRSALHHRMPCWADVCQGSAPQLLCLYCTHREWFVFKMYTRVLIYTVRLTQHMWSQSASRAVSTGGDRRIPAGRTRICHANQDILPHVLARVAGTREHRRNKPTGQVEHPDMCLMDAQNQTRKAAALSWLLEAFSNTRDELQAFMVQSAVKTEIKVSISVG